MSESDCSKFFRLPIIGDTFVRSMREYNNIPRSSRGLFRYGTSTSSDSYTYSTYTVTDYLVNTAITLTPEYIFPESKFKLRCNVCGEDIEYNNNSTCPSCGGYLHN